jgi:hypothetical protein
MPALASTSGRLLQHSEFVRLLFLQALRETDRCFPTSEVQLTETHRGMFHYLRSAFSSTLKSRVGSAGLDTRVQKKKLSVAHASVLDAHHSSSRR